MQSAIITSNDTQAHNTDNEEQANRTDTEAADNAVSTTIDAIAVSSAASNTARLRDLLPLIASSSHHREYQLCFGLALIPSLTQLLFHCVTYSSTPAIQQLGLDPEDFGKASTSGLQTHGDRYRTNCDRPDTMFHTFLFMLGLTLTLIKGAFQALAVVYPSYKTYKALESRSLRASQAMLLYWCITAFVNSVKELADQVLGNYSSFFFWKFFVVLLKAAPLLIGPDRMYDSLVKPLFESNEVTIDAVVTEAHKVKSLAQSAVPAVKEGDVESVKEKAEEIIDVVKEDTSELVHSLQAQALELTDHLQAKSAEYGVAWSRAGVIGLLEKVVAQFEHGRDAVMEFARDRWQEHGPWVMEKTMFLREKTIEYAPIAREKAVNLYQQQVAPRVQPLVGAVNQKYQSTVKPFVVANSDKVVQIWAQHGGPIRRVYASKVRPFLRNTAQPFLTQKLIPFLIDSFLPAVYETIIALKDKLMDLASSPSEEVKATRVHHKRRRDQARKEKRLGRAEWKQEPTEGQIFKRQKTHKTDDSSSSSSPAPKTTNLQMKDAQREAMIKADPDTTSYAVDRSDAEGMTSHPQATLFNRKNKDSVDASLDKTNVEQPHLKQDVNDSIVEQSDLNPSAPVFEPQSDKQLDSAVSESEPVDFLTGDKKNVSLLDSSDVISIGGPKKHTVNEQLGEKEHAWGTEKRTSTGQFEGISAE